jgi:cell division protein FtsB
MWAIKYIILIETEPVPIKLSNMESEQASINSSEHIPPTSLHPRTYYGTVGVERTASQNHDRGIVAVAAGISNTVNIILSLITAVLGVLVVASGGILGYQGSVTAPPFNYVLFVFAGVNIVAGIYIIVRVFGIQNMINQLKSVNAELKITEAKLSDEVVTLRDTNEKLNANVQNLETNMRNLETNVQNLNTENAKITKTAEHFDVINSDLIRTECALKKDVLKLSEETNKLRLAISAIVQASDSTIEVGSLIKDILDDIKQEREKITTEREAAELFTTRLTALIFTNMDLNSDGVVDKAEQQAWLGHVRGGLK